MAVYLITGVSRGIGRVLAEQLAGQAHQVIGTIRTPDSDRPDGLAGVLAADLTDPVAVGAALAALPGGLPLLDGLVHCAGIVRPGSLADDGAADLLEQLRVNVVAVADLTRRLLPSLRAAAGTVVFVNSGSGLNVRPPLSSYGISKHALRAYADALRLEEPGLRVSSVYPGRTATTMQQAVRAAEGGSYVEADYLRPATVAAVIASVLTLPADGVLTDVTLRPAGPAGRAAASPDQLG